MLPRYQNVRKLEGIGLEFERILRELAFLKEQNQQLFQEFLNQFDPEYLLFLLQNMQLPPQIIQMFMQLINYYPPPVVENGFHMKATLLEDGQPVVELPLFFNKNIVHNIMYRILFEPLSYDTHKFIKSLFIANPYDHVYATTMDTVSSGWNGYFYYLQIKHTFEVNDPDWPNSNPLNVNPVYWLIYTDIEEPFNKTMTEIQAETYCHGFFDGTVNPFYVPNPNMQTFEVLTTFEMVFPSI